MAYREQPEPHQAPHAAPYHGNHDAQEFHDQTSYYENLPKGRSRASSSAVSETPAPPIEPIKNAIGNAFDKSDAARIVDPDLIAQITAEVKKSVLDEIKLSGIAPLQPVPVSPAYYVPPSPASTSASVPLRDVYTPPSPKHVDSQDFYSQAPPVANSTFDHSLFEGNDDTPTPRGENPPPPIDTPRERSSVRPTTTKRMSTDEYTPIEKMWQRLFDPDGSPLPRLGEFLRGLALHLIEDYEPKKSLVISPCKMYKFYEEVALPDEIYPWQTIFGKLPYASLSKIYRDMRCQHHLIQEHPAEQPYIPALTPEGFQEWMTAMILAYPDTEYQRVAKAVLAMPISNAEDRKERFPKELPRRLFPSAENLQAQQRCAANLSAEGVGPLRKAPTFPPPPPKTHTTRAASAVPNLERERSPYVSKPEAKFSESEDEVEPASVTIERQRKPYSATPGGGKQHEEDHNRCAHSDAAANEQRRRTQSIASQWAPPAHEAHHSQQHYHHSRTGSTANTRRPRSPSFSGYGTQSDPTVRDIPSSYYTSNMHDIGEEGRRYTVDIDGKKHDRHRRSTAGTDSSHDSQPRSLYDDDDFRGRGTTNGHDRGYDSRRY